MKKLAKYSLVAIVLLIALGIIVFPELIQHLEGSKTDYCGFVYRDTNERKDYITKECRKAGAWGTVTITEVERKILNCKNHSQSNLVAAYNANRAVPDRDKNDPKQGLLMTHGMNRVPLKAGIHITLQNR